MRASEKFVVLVFAAALGAAACFIPTGVTKVGNTAQYSYSGISTKANLSNGDVSYKVQLSKDGKLKIKIRSECQDTTVVIYDPDDVPKHTEKVPWNADDKIGKASFECELEAGVYYIKFKKGSVTNEITSGNIFFTATYPDAKARSTVSPTKEDSSEVILKLTVKENDKIKLNDVLDGEEKSATWSSSNTKVARVDRHGNVSPVSVGDCIITCKTDSAVLKIYIEVEPE